MLTIKDLNKSFGDFKALNGVNLQIDEGEVFGFIGPNGAGKSTTMKIISGLLSADSGEVYVDGIDALKHNKKLKEKIGYMPDYIGVYDNLKAIEYLEFYGSIYGILGKTARKKGLELLDLVQLGDKAEVNVDKLSRGMKQRLSLARSMMHDPKLLILDEPASGMDPRARFEMKNILRNLKDLDKTVLVSSHILSELGEICSRVGIIDKGTIVSQGTIEEIMEEAGGKNPIKISLIGEVEKGIKLVSDFEGIANVKQDGQSILANLKGGEEEAYELLKYLVLNEIKVSSFNRKEGNLEDLFIQLTETRED
ncbi:MAG: ATP-binding cassette domain-containing protein [Clostridium sp.]